MRILTFDIEDWFHILDNASTKTEADRLVREAAELHGLKCTIVRPSIVFGQSMNNRSLMQMLEIVRRGLFFFVGEGGNNEVKDQKLS